MFALFFLAYYYNQVAQRVQVNAYICAMLIEKLLSIITQKECLVCNHSGEIVCRSCWQTEFKLRTPTCFMCNALSDIGKTCPKCRRKSSLNGVTTNYRLVGPMQDLIYGFKYYGNREIASFVAQNIITRLPKVKFDCITYVPATGKSQRKRGYNQAELLARHVAKQNGLPLKPALLRLRHTDQIGLGRAQRFESVKDNFVARGKFEGKNILIVDDVITTGATLSECASVLKASGAKKIWGLTIAKK